MNTLPPNDAEIERIVCYFTLSISDFRKETRQWPIDSFDRAADRVSTIRDASIGIASLDIDNRRRSNIEHIHTERLAAEDAKIHARTQQAIEALRVGLDAVTGRIEKTNTNLDSVKAAVEKGPMPHWSTTPAFWVISAALLVTIIGAVYSVLQYYR